MSKLLLKEATAYIDSNLTIKDILIVDGHISSIGYIEQTDEMEVLNCSDKLVCLGFVDMHTHLRSPGYEYKETVASGTKSALLGGYSHVVAMANTNPVMDTVEVVEEFEKLVEEQAFVNTYTYAAITKGLAGKELVDMEKLLEKKIVVGFSDDGKGIQSSSMMKEAMQKVAKLNSIIVAHCEDESELKPGGCVHDGKFAEVNNYVGINSASEYKQVERDLDNLVGTHAQYHICHISTKESVKAMTEAKQRRLLVSGEVTPHHLLLTDAIIPADDANFKMNPPLRSIEDREALIKGLRDGVIQVIATDHAPHSKEEKVQGIKKAPFGIIGLQHAFPLLYTYLVKNNYVPLHTLLDALTTNPSRILGVPHMLKKGFEANLAIIDLNKEYEIKEEDIVSKSVNTPFIGQKVFGEVEYMIINGKLINIMEMKEGIKHA